MQCPSCKSELICGLGTHCYKESGLDNVYLRQIEICECSCGEKIVSIPLMPQLHRKIGAYLVKKKSLLTGKEIKFLRKNMELTAKVLSTYLGIDNATMSRWERNHQAISKPHDRLLRLIYCSIKGIPPEEIKYIIEEEFAQILPKQEEIPYYDITIDESNAALCMISEEARS